MSTNSTTSEETSELNHKGHNTRIYVLHHNANPDANELITSIYRWFRTGSKAGIPVYVRTNHTSQRYSSNQTYEAMELPYAVHANDAIRNKNLGALEYLLILIDPHMVNSVSWREYLNKLLVCESRSKEGVWKSGGGQGRVVLVPIAFDDSAFNLPSGYSSRNMIRFNAATGNIRELLKNITESILQDMTPRIGRYADLNEKFRIFISYARADSEAVPKRLRSYIQSSTQFDAFLDENDILYGRNFKDVISDTLSKQATALFAVQGDNYADRPWCRYELQSFRYPRNITETFEESITDEVFGVKSHNRIKIYNIMPIVTINSAQGDLETRVIPELAQSPLIPVSYTHLTLPTICSV